MKHTRRRVPKQHRRRNKSRVRKSKHNKRQHRSSSKKRTFRRKQHMKGGDLFASDTTTLFGINVLCVLSTSNPIEFNALHIDCVLTFDKSIYSCNHCLVTII